MQRSPKFVPVVTINGREQFGGPTSFDHATEYVAYARRAGFLAVVKRHEDVLNRAAAKASQRRFTGQALTGFGAL